MKKQIFSLAFLLIITILSQSMVLSQPIPQYFRFDLSHFFVTGNEGENNEVSGVENESKTDFMNSNLKEKKEKSESTTPRGSSRLSIDLGKALFEKYIK